MSDRICLEFDEYGPAGADGYGFTIEQTSDETPESPPLVGHLLVIMLRTPSAQAHPPTNLLLSSVVSRHQKNTDVRCRLRGRAAMMSYPSLASHVIRYCLFRQAGGLI